MKRVVFVLLCATAIVAIPACKQLSCKKEVAEMPMVPPAESAPAGPVDVPVQAPDVVPPAE